LADNIYQIFLERSDQWRSEECGIRHESSTEMVTNSSILIILTYLLTYSMEQSTSWEANRFCS